MSQLPFEENAGEQFPFSIQEFADNPEPRVPCILILDVSGSMAGDPIRQLNDGLVCYKDALSADSLASKRVEISIVTFGLNVEMPVEFTTVENFFPPKLDAQGMTPMGQAVNLAIDSLEARKQQYKDAGISYYRPWLFLITDGEPNDPNWETAARRAVEGDRAKSFSMFCVGVENANFETLAKFSNREPLRLQGLEFRKLFLWLSSSQQTVSRSTPGDEVPLENPAAPNGWAVV